MKNMVWERVKKRHKDEASLKQAVTNCFVDIFTVIGGITLAVAIRIVFF